MAQSSWPDPANSREVTDVEYERLSARFSDDGVYGSPADPAVVAPGTGLSVGIRPDVAASVRGHGWYSGGSTITVPLSENLSSQPRVDWIVLRLDRADWSVRADKVVGTPGAGAPALTQQTGDTGVYEIPLALARVLGGASSVTVTRAELYVGTRTRPCTSTTRNPAPLPGERGFETDTGREIIWTGTSWEVVSSTWTWEVVNSPLSAWGRGTETVIESRNRQVHLRFGTFRRTGGTLAADAGSRLPILIPAAYRHPTRAQFALCYIGGSRIGRLVVQAAGTSRAGQAWLEVHPSISSGDVVLPHNISWTV